MLVYVLNRKGSPLMPCKPQKARKLLKSGMAKVAKRTPFTIQLQYGSSGYKQNVTLGVDAGSRHIGLSATTDKKELYAADVELRKDIVSLIATRREFRHARRNRKTRYRKPRFDNRVSAKKGWAAPSVRQKIHCHLKAVEGVCKILPVSRIIVETASFDIQKIKNPGISGTGYQQGEQMGFWNVREYVLFRDGHTCQCCKGKSRDKILNVHHIEGRKTGGDAPDNLITLCGYCHSQYHKGKVTLPDSVKRGKSFRDAAFMGIMRRAFYGELKKRYPDVAMTYGYITKHARIKNHLPKEHYADARCISGNPTAEPLGYYFYQKKVRCHNRQIHKANILKGGRKKLNQAPYLVHGFRIYDKVLYDGTECFIFGRRASGYFDIRKLDGKSIHKSASYKKLKFLEPGQGYLTERRSMQGMGAA